MKNRFTSWEIVLAGLALTSVALFLMARAGDNESVSQANVSQVPGHPEAPEVPHPNMPGAVVIDLERLESLRSLGNLENLRNLGNIENLDIRLENLEALMESESEEATVRTLEELRKHLEEAGKANFRVQLQNRKLFINRNYNVEQANWTEVSPGVYVFRQTLDTENVRRLELLIGFGNLTIVGSENGGGELTLKATGDIPGAQVLAEQLTVERSEGSEGNAIRVTGAEGSDLRNRINLNATLTVPRSLALQAITRGGHINASNLEGNHSFETSAGHVNLSAVSGSTVVRSSGGHIIGELLSGEADLKTTGGHIRVSDFDGSLVAQTGGGHIDMQSLSGQVEARTSGGNINASMASAGGPLSFTTSAGNLTLVLPSGVQADIQADGSQVTLAEGFAFDGTQTNGSLDGTLNGGGIPITLRCSFGNIVIRHE
ncbi:MAG: DUF4097 family beta strand repeat-containing protein [Balneolaceae bacterium]|nr:DUF4097 family beta strand repeat-containing protein [Balneolaceae bacterium]